MSEPSEQNLMAWISETIPGLFQHRMTIAVVYDKSYPVAIECSQSQHHLACPRPNRGTNGSTCREK